MRLERIWRREGRVFSRWKNGGGETAEIVVMPPDADIESFDWRISTAIVASSGPFSRFDGVERCLAILEGGPMELTFADRPAVMLDETAPALEFPGDIACAARLDGPGVLDLNVMVRRPLRVRIMRAPIPPAPRQAMRYLVALAPIPALGLARHDLAELAADAEPPADALPALWIEIVRP